GRNRMLGFRKVLLLISWVLSLASSSALQAQSTVTLTATATPSVGQPGVTTINVTGSGFPSGTIQPGSVVVTLTPAGGGPALTTQATTVPTIVGTTRRVTFTIPAGIAVLIPTNYVVSISGTTTTGIAFASTNTSALTINPAASVSLSPAQGQAGQ